MYTYTYVVRSQTSNNNDWMYDDINYGLIMIKKKIIFPKKKLQFSSSNINDFNTLQNLKHCTVICKSIETESFCKIKLAPQIAINNS